MTKHAKSAPPYRISNQAWAYGTADRLWEGQENEFLTAGDYNDMRWGQYEVWLEEHIASNYGDCGLPITGTGDYEQLLAEEARERYYGLSNPYFA